MVGDVGGWVAEDGLHLSIGPFEVDISPSSVRHR